MMGFLSGFSSKIVLIIGGLLAAGLAFITGGRRAKSKEKAKRDAAYIETRKRMDQYDADTDDLSVADRLRKHSE